MEIAAGLVVGLLGSLHCVGMCGPLALALPVPRGSIAAFYTGRILYNAGRMVTYVLLGLLAGSVGRFIVLTGWQQGLSLAAGVILLLSVLLPSVSVHLSSRFSFPGRLTGRVQQALSLLFRRRSVPVLFLVGVLNGLLPCGFVYVGLTAAATTGGILPAALFMAGFGLGTVPVMFGVSLAGRHIGPALRKRLSALTPALTVVVAVIIIMRGMNLGIPYISPSLPGEAASASTPCCH